MLPHGKRPIRAFLGACLGLSALATGALAYTSLRGVGAEQYCAQPETVTALGVCQPEAEFFAIVLIWFVLIWGALAMPMGSVWLITRVKERFQEKRRAAGHGPSEDDPGQN